VRLDDAFEVRAPAANVWDVLNDVPAVVPCLPGAVLTEAIGEDVWKAIVHVKLGPIALQFETIVTREVADATERRVVLDATARELRGRGGAHARIESTLTERDGTTHVDVVTDLTLKGTVAQYGRSVVPAVAAQLTQQFARNLADLMEAREERSNPAPPEQRPVPALRLAWDVVRQTRLGYAVRAALARVRR
jgi:uncharacterized protein